MINELTENEIAHLANIMDGIIFENDSDNEETEMIPAREAEQHSERSDENEMLDDERGIIFYF